jgi:hypothetical protein
MPAFFQRVTFQEAVARAERELDRAGQVAELNWRDTRFRAYLEEFAATATSGNTARVWESASQLFQLELSRPVWSLDPNAPELLRQVFRGEPSWRVDDAGTDTTDKDDPGRNFLLELAVAGVYAAGGGHVALTPRGAKGDVILTTSTGKSIVVECKRPMWKTSLDRNLRKATEQLAAIGADYRVIAVGIDRLVVEDEWPVVFAGSAQETEEWIQRGVRSYQAALAASFARIGPPAPTDVAATTLFLTGTVLCRDGANSPPFTFMSSWTSLNGPDPELQAELEILGRDVRLPE